MKWYNVELFPRQALELKYLLYDLLVKFETSACGDNFIHFEILLDPAGPEFETINNFLLEGAI